MREKFLGTLTSLTANKLWSSPDTSYLIRTQRKTSNCPKF